MNLREALFLSSLSKAEYHCSISSRTEYREYRVQVEIKDAKYQPFLGSEPVHKDVFEITVSRVAGSGDEQKVYPPHLVELRDSLEECIEYLQRWGVGEEYQDPWHPVDEWGKQEEGKQ